MCHDIYASSLIALGISLALSACLSKGSDIATVEASETPITFLGDLHGEVTPYTIERVNVDSVNQPKKVPLHKPPKVFTLSSNNIPAGKPPMMDIPENLTVITPGENGVPIPDTLPVFRKVMPAYQVPFASIAAPIKQQNTIADITNLSVAQGLHSSNVHSIIEDRRGDLWIGQRSGVLRYNGQSQQLFTAKEGFVDDNPWRIYEDSRGLIWFATFKGHLISYNGQYFTHYFGDGNRDLGSPQDIVEDQLGNIWFGSGMGGLLCFTGQHFIHYTTKHGLSDNGIRSLAIGDGGNVLIGTNNGGLNIFDGTCFTHYSTKEGLSSNFVKAIEPDNDGNFWLGTYGGGLNLFVPPNAANNSAGTIIQYKPDQNLKNANVLSLLNDDRGHLWIGTDGNGMYVYDGENFRHYSKKTGLSHNNILALAQDDWGNIWSGTSEGGINRFALNSAVTHTSLEQYIAHQEIKCIIEDSHGDLWIGTFGSGVLHVSQEKDVVTIAQYTTEQGLLSNSIIAMAQDHQGNFWFSHFETGISRFETFDSKNYTAGMITHFTPAEGLRGISYMGLEIDSKGRIWLGSQFGEGLSLYDPTAGRGTFFNIIFEDPCLDFVYHILEDSKNHLWFATNCGILKYEPEKSDWGFTHYHDQRGLKKSIISLLEDKDGAIWAVGMDGAVKYDSQKGLFHYGNKDGLLSEAVYAIQEDVEGRIWILSELGLNALMFDPRKTKEISDPLIPTYEIRSMTRQNGILHPASSPNSFLIDQHNQAWLGHSDGWSIIDLDEMQFSTNTPKVHLNTVDIIQSPIDYRQLQDSSYREGMPFGDALVHAFDTVSRFYNYPVHPKFPYQINHLTFHFSAIDWASPQQVRYSYRLVGQEHQWTLPSKDTKADFRNLPPGDYRFQVKALGSANRWSDVFEYPLQINTPWWQSWLAYLLYAAAISGIWYGLYRFLLVRKLAMQEAHQLREMDRFKTQFYTNITHEFRTPLTVINGMADIVLENPENWFREGVTMIKRNGKHLLQMINQLLDLSKLESNSLPVNLIQDDIIAYLKYLTESLHSLAATKEICLSIDTDKDQWYMDFDPAKIQSIFTNLVGNAIKFTPPGGDIHIRIRCDGATGIEKGLQLKISDNGDGIAEEDLPFVFDRFHQNRQSTRRVGEGSGIGLALTREMVKLLDGRISLTSKDGEGTEVTVELPVARQAGKEAATDLINESVSVEETEVFSYVGTVQTMANTDDELPLALLIEDQQDVMNYLSICLLGQYRLEMARNGCIGIEKAIQLVPDIIISDVMMPEKDGFEVVHTLKHDKRTSHIPIILLTAKADLDSRLQGLDRGADAYLTKPFERLELEVRLRKLIELRRHLSNRYSALHPVVAPANAAEAQEDLFIQGFRETVERGMDKEDFGITFLCRELGVSRSQLHRKLKALTGRSTSQAIRTIRMQKAKELLKQRSMNISEVGFAVGYSNPSYFTREFIKEFGEPPSDYRNKGVNQ
ncbi:MAG: helix-turn-helix domain-containing protein [Saprospiraceae bacterium]|nr:helix-turn-helix domain-containing protein [Saprospiraceae bacterium]